MDDIGFYIDWTKLASALFPVWVQSQYDWVFEVKNDTSIVNQLARHYRENYICVSPKYCIAK